MEGASRPSTEGGGDTQGGSQDRVEIRLMSRNLFLGADTSLVVGSFLNGTSDMEERAMEVLRQLEANDFHDRARSLVDEIQEAQPHITAMQEVVLAAHGGGSGATTIDHLEILQEEIRGRGLPYAFLSPQVTTVVDLRTASGTRIGFTDRIALLVHREVEVRGCRSDRFQAVQPTPGGVMLERGWIAADCTLEETAFRVVNTHLEVQAFPECQARQVGELVGTVLPDPELSTFLMGDFNSNADGGEGDSTWTPAHEVLTAAGFRDLWAEHRASERAAGRDAGPGHTCCHQADLSLEGGVLDQRIDFIFHRGGVPVDILGMARVGIDPAKRTESLGLWPSDHAGIIARVSVSR